MTYFFTLAGETPAKKNSRITLKNGMTIPSKNYREWHKTALQELALQTKPESPIDSAVRIQLRFIHGDLRRRDSDNGCSSVLDLLTDAGILADDNWQIVRQIRVQNEYGKNKAKCEIAISDFSVGG